MIKMMTTPRILLPQRRIARTAFIIGARRFLATGKPDMDDDGDSLYNKNRINAMVGHNFPDFIEAWNRATFRKVGYGLSAMTAFSAVGSAITGGLSNPVTFVPTVILGALTAGYWKVGLTDIKQSSHAIRRNYPVLGNLRYILETVRTMRV